jgi:hypothetical protein
MYVVFFFPLLYLVGTPLQMWLTLEIALLSLGTLRTKCVLLVLEFEWDCVWQQGAQLEGNLLKFLIQHFIL